MFLMSEDSSVPSTSIRPFWCSSSALMQRMSVDLPDPEGPAITIRSPRWTVRSMSRSTWKLPYHLFIFSMRIATSSLIFISTGASVVICAVSAMDQASVSDDRW